METSKFLQLIILLIRSLIVIYIEISSIRTIGDITSNTKVNIPLTKVITFTYILTWFISITILISLFHNLFNKKISRGINLMFGVVIYFYGLKLLYTFYISL